jgi:hypothetical protein
LTGASRFWSDWTPVTGQQYGYGFGNIGNRASSLVGSKRPLGSYLNKAPRREEIWLGLIRRRLAMAGQALILSP